VDRGVPLKIFQQGPGIAELFSRKGRLENFERGLLIIIAWGEPLKYFSGGHCSNFCIAHDGTVVFPDNVPWGSGENFHGGASLDRSEGGD
jgi:hypothetical protein